MNNRLRTLVLTVFAILVTVTAGTEDAVTVTADPFPMERSGQYVYYYDMRTGIYGSEKPLNRLMGILKIADKKYIIRICYPADGRTFFYTGRYVLKNGVMEFTPENIQGDAKEGTMIMADLLNLLNYMGSETLKLGQRLKGKENFSVNSAWENYGRKFVNAYKWWVPFYKLSSMSETGTGKQNAAGDPVLKLLCFGSVYDADAETFTQISKLPVSYNEKSDLKKYAIPAAEKVPVTMAGIKFTLDKNWGYEKPDPASGIMHETYWLKKFTVRDAQIGIESIDISNMLIEKNEIDSFTATLQYQTCVVADTVSVDAGRKILTLSLWEPKAGSCTLTKYRSLGIKNKVLTLLNFSAFDFVYFANMEYFNAIINVKGQ